MNESFAETPFVEATELPGVVDIICHYIPFEFLYLASSHWRDLYIRASVVNL